MTARILVVDDVPANVKLLEARLRAEYFETVAATNGQDALEICESGRIDLVLLDVMMPGIDGFEVCRRLKANPSTMHIPVVIVTALDDQNDRIAGLDAGADDFLTKPANDLQLISRVKSLVRLKSLTDELRLRASTARTIGLEDHRRGVDQPARVLLVDDRESSRNRVAAMASTEAVVDVVGSHGATAKAATGDYECIIISTNLEGSDPLRLCSHLKAVDQTRHAPILLIADPVDDDRVARALELGVNDYLTRPVVQQELLARIRTQVRRKRYNDQLRSSVARSIEMAVTDGLTGLHNRRYLDTHLDTLVERSVAHGRPLSVVMLDLDHFKRINDTLGHDAGVQVLREVAKRLRRNLRGLDLACRYGGEEFVLAMPETPARSAGLVAERIRTQLGNIPVDAAGTLVPVSASLGVATVDLAGDDSAALLKRADAALYRAKHGGRNRVILDEHADAVAASGKIAV